MRILATASHVGSVGTAAEIAETVGQDMQTIDSKKRWLPDAGGLRSRWQFDWGSAAVDALGRLTGQTFEEVWQEMAQRLEGKAEGLPQFWSGAEPKELTEFVLDYVLHLPPQQGLQIAA